MTIIVRRQWRQQPQLPVRLDRNNPLLRSALHWWHLTSVFGYRDLVGSAHGTPVGVSTCPTTEGMSTQYVSGTRYINVGNPSDIAFGTGSFTFGVRVYLSSLAGEVIVLGKDDDSAGRQFHWKVASDGNVTFFIGTSSVVGSAGAQFTTDKWHDLIYTRDGSSNTIYLNNEVIAITTDSTSMSSESANLYIGGRSYSGYNNPITGFLQSAFILSRAWSSDEVIRFRANRWQVFSKRMRIIPTAIAVATPTLSALNAINVTASSAQPRITYTF